LSIFPAVAKTRNDFAIFATAETGCGRGQMEALVPPAEQIAEKLDWGSVSGRAGLQASVQAFLYESEPA
jgi:hypothetical protein